MDHGLSPCALSVKFLHGHFTLEDKKLRGTWQIISKHKCNSLELFETLKILLHRQLSELRSHDSLKELTKFTIVFIHCLNKIKINFSGIKFA